MISARIPRDLWIRDYQDAAHISVFGEECPDLKSSLFEYALLVIDEESNTPIIYITIKETSTESAFIEFGGSFPPFRGSTKVLKAFRFICNEMNEKLGMKVISLITRNTNVAMQKLALSVGYIVQGVTVGKYGLCLEYRLNFTKENTDG